MYNLIEQGYHSLLFLETYQLSENSTYPENINTFRAEDFPLMPQPFFDSPTPGT
jgi:hypothetical protein